jgi:hypothetical protein
MGRDLRYAAIPGRIHDAARPENTAFGDAGETDPVDEWSTVL